MERGSTPPRRSRLARAGPLVGVLATLVLAAPSLNAPLLQDDVAHRLMREGKLPGGHWGPLELYDFVGGPHPVALLRDGGSVPWFVDEDLKLRFFRPLSSALLAADWAIFGERTWARRLHSLAWFLAIVALAAAIHRRLLSPAAAGLATLIFAVAEGHAVPIAWIAARHTLISTAFGLAAVWLHLRARDDGWSPGRWLAPSALVAGLLAGEVALGAVALIAARELFGRREPIADRARALIPVALTAVSYLAFYAVAGYGVRGGRAYIGLDSGIDGAMAALRHFFILAGELIAATPSDPFGSVTATVQAGAAAWGAAMAAVAWLLFHLLRAYTPARDAEALRWLPVAAAAAAVPGALGVVGGRVLTLALVPASGAVAVLLVAGCSAARQRQVAGLRRAFVAVTVAGLALGHLVTGPLIRWVLSGLLTDLAAVEVQIAQTTPRCDGTMVLPVASDPALAVYVPATMVLGGFGPRRLRVLSMAPADHRIDNVTATGFDLVMLDPGRSWTLWEEVYRGSPLPAGTRVTISALDALVLEDRDGIPVRMRFDFGEPLDSPGLCFYQWRGRRLSRLAIPGPGGTVHLVHERGPGGW